MAAPVTRGAVVSVSALFPTLRHRVPGDVERVLTMPREALDGGPLAVAWAQRLNASGATLRPIQGHALEVISRYKTLFGSIGVGHGKTLICLLAGAAAGAKRPLLLCPPALVEQMKEDAFTWAPFFDFTPPEILSYGKLSTVAGSAILEGLRPDLIIADEVHALRHKTSARTKRVLRYFREHPGAGFVGVSGTITARSLLDYAHLLELCLRDRAPIPLSPYELNAWAACIDPDGEATRADWRRLWPLVTWSGGSDFMPDKTEERRPILREAFRKRLASTPGVVCTRSSSCDASLHIVEHRPPVGEALTKAIANLAARWETPDGEPIADAATYSRIARQLSVGFYYRWEWEGDPDLDWLEKRRAWVRAVARVLRYSAREGLDSPALVAAWVEGGRGNPATHDAWRAWQEVKHKPAPETVPVWIDEGVIDYARRWLDDGDPSILWYQSRAIGERLARHLPTFGADTACPSTSHPATVAASIAVHGKGRNLQAYHCGFVLEPPASGSAWEQLIGRFHRQGQASHLVEFHVLQHTQPLQKALERARSDALYIEQTQGQKQKLNFARFVRA